MSKERFDVYITPVLSSAKAKWSQNSFQLIVIQPNAKYLLQPNITGTNQNSQQVHVTGAKRGKNIGQKSRLVLVLLLIGWERMARVLLTNQKPK